MWVLGNNDAEIYRREIRFNHCVNHSAPTMQERQQNRWAITGLIAGVMTTVALIAPTTTPTAQALCVAPPAGLTGTWNNVDAQTRGIRTVKIRYACNDVVLCPVGQPCRTPPPSGFYIQPLGACHPQACDWGAQSARYIAPRKLLLAQFKPGFAVKTVSARVLTSGTRKGQLQLTHHTKFIDGSGRRDYSMTEYFVK